MQGAGHSAVDLLPNDVRVARVSGQLFDEMHEVEARLDGGGLRTAVPLAQALELDAEVPLDRLDLGVHSGLKHGDSALLGPRARRARSWLSVSRETLMGRCVTLTA